MIKLDVSITHVTAFLKGNSKIGLMHLMVISYIDGDC